MSKTQATRANNAAVKTRIAQASKPADAQPAETDTTSGWEEVYKRYHEAQEQLMSFFQAPGWKRTLVAAVTYLAGVAGLLYVGSTVVEAVLLSAFVGAVPMFIGLCIAIIGACLIAWYGHKLVLRCTGAVLTGEADERAVAAYDAVKGMFAKINPFKRPEILGAKA